MKVFTDLLSSKKFIAMLIGLAFVLIAKILDLGEVFTNWGCGLIASYILGQGAADFGKERGKNGQEKTETTPAA